MVGHEASFTPPVNIPLVTIEGRDIPLELASQRPLNPEELRRSKYHLSPVEKEAIGGGLEVALSSQEGIKYYNPENLLRIWQIREAILRTPIALQLPYPSTIEDINIARANQTIVAHPLLPKGDLMRRRLYIDNRGLISPAIRLAQISHDCDPLIDGLEIIFVSNGNVIPLEDVIKKARHLGRGDKENRQYYRNLSTQTIQLNDFLNGFERTVEAKSIYIDFKKPLATQ